LFSSSSPPPPPLPSFPTRRSSDLRLRSDREYADLRAPDPAVREEPLVLVSRDSERRAVDGHLVLLRRRQDRCPIRKHELQIRRRDRKSTRLNSSHLGISYAVFCLK